MPKTTLTIDERFDAKVDRSGDCWVWTAAIFQKTGYGAFRVGRRTLGAHRWAFEREYGPLAKGLVPDHLCRNHACVRPSHMEPVTNRVNTLRGNAPGAIAHRTGRCIRAGHSLDDAYVAHRSDGRVSRTCRTCALERRAATLAELVADPDDRRHGTDYGYGVGCRCTPCTATCAPRARRQRAA